MSAAGFEGEVSLKWPLENELPNVYANHIQYVATEHEIILVFGSFLPTGFRHGEEDEVEEFLSEVTIRPEAKIVMSKGSFRSLYNILKRYFEESESEEVKVENGD